MATKSYYLLLLSVFSPFAALSCSDEPADPLDSASGFCEEWGKNACVEGVLRACQATASNCHDEQEARCLDRISDAKYTRTGAEECLKFIRDAYRDQALELDELRAFSSLGAPCDMLLAGNGDVGDTCKKTEDCDTTSGLQCVIKSGDTRGECHVPKDVSGGGKCSDANAVCGAEFYCNGSNCIAKSITDEDCSADIPCSETTRCVMEEEAVVGQCEPKLEVGRDCETNEQCATGICDRNEDEVEDDVPGVCVEFLELGRRVDMCREFR
jgi:hypothetical protein